MTKECNAYNLCPTYETDSFILRLVCMEDADDLLNCYSDKLAVQKMNADFCTSDFYFTTLGEMRGCLRFWLDEYQNGAYVRFAVVDKDSKKAVGTVEIFGGEVGILRIDLATNYEKNNYIEEITVLAISDFIYDFNIGKLVVKAEHTPKRLDVYKKYAFVKSKTFRPGMGYYEYINKGIAYCGLACCLCSENIVCSGCKNKSCAEYTDCKNFNCCDEKKINGCWECSEFPCTGSMLDKIRLRAFSKFAYTYGEKELVSHLMRNKAHGISYHYPDQLIGDYDLGKTEDEIINIIRRGCVNQKKKGEITND